MLYSIKLFEQGILNFFFMFIKILTQILLCIFLGLSIYPFKFKIQFRGDLQSTPIFPIFWFFIIFLGFKSTFKFFSIPKFQNLMLKIDNNMFQIITNPSNEREKDRFQYPIEHFPAIFMKNQSNYGFQNITCSLSWLLFALPI